MFPLRLLRAAARGPLSSVTSVATEQPLVALTYDDGPDPRLTPAVLEVLRLRSARATFLLVAERVRQHPDLARQVVEAGHEVGLHCDVHVDMCELPPAAQRAALRRGRRDLEAILGVPIRWFRPPYGRQRPETVLAARSLRLRPLLWSASAHDWEHSSIEDQVAHARTVVRQGSIVLLHDGNAHVAHPPPSPPATQPAITERVLDLVDRSGLQPVTVSELCARGRSVREPWFEQWLHH